MIIKYDVEGKVVWGTSVGEKYVPDYIEAVVGTTDGGIVVGGYFWSDTIELGNGQVLENSDEYYSDGMIIKYMPEGNEYKAVWGASVGGKYYHDEINAIVETSDGGIVAVGNFYSRQIQLDNGQVLEHKRWH